MESEDIADIHKKGGFEFLRSALGLFKFDHMICRSLQDHSSISSKIIVEP